MTVTAAFRGLFSRSSRIRQSDLHHTSEASVDRHATWLPEIFRDAGRYSRSLPGNGNLTGHSAVWLIGFRALAFVYNSVKRRALAGLMLDRIVNQNVCPGNIAPAAPRRSHHSSESPSVA